MESENKFPALISRALSGDNPAFDELIDESWDTVAGVVASVFRTHGMSESIEDGIQSVFHYLVTKRDQGFARYNPEKGLYHKFIANIARFRAIDYMRKHGNSRITTMEELPEPAANSLDDLPMIESWELAAAMARLTARERAVVELYYYEHLTVGEIADRLSISEATVRSHHSHALATLKKYFGAG